MQNINIQYVYTANLDTSLPSKIRASETSLKYRAATAPKLHTIWPFWSKGLKPILSQNSARLVGLWNCLVKKANDMVNDIGYDRANQWNKELSWQIGA